MRTAPSPPLTTTDDFIDGVIDALKWDCVPGHAVGTGSQWALPMGWEINILTYNKQILADHNITPPKTAEELLAAATALKEFDGSGTYGLALRGTADWGTIHPAYMSSTPPGAPRTSRSRTASWCPRSTPPRPLL